MTNSKAIKPDPRIKSKSLVRTYGGDSSGLGMYKDSRADLLG